MPRLVNFWTTDRCGVVVIALGVLLRLRDYLAVRSLWLDEAMLGRNIIDRSFGGLFQPLDHDQGAPVGFLVAQKLLVSLFGPGEEVFRLLPSLLGIWSLILFARLSKQLLGPTAALAILPLFAFSPFLVQATNKQYPVDLWATLFLLSLVLRVADAESRWRDFGILAVVGACLVWMSHTVPLVEAGFGTAVMVAHARAGRWSRAVGAAAVAGCWLVSFTALYWISIRHLHANEFLLIYWQQGILPRSGGVAEYIAWARQLVAGTFSNPGRLSPQPLAIALAAIGAARLARDPLRFGVVVLPIAIAFAAACARMFPFQGRLILFLVPAYLWLVGAGLDGLNSSVYKPLRCAAWVALIVLLMRPALDAKSGFGPVPRWEESREVLKYVAQNAEAGDVLYVHPSARHTFAFYREQLALDGVTVVYGEPMPPAEAARQIREFPAAHRVWVFHSVLPVTSPHTPLTREELLATAGTGRTPLDRRDAPGVCVALFSKAE